MKFPKITAESLCFQTCFNLSRVDLCEEQVVSHSILSGIEMPYIFWTLLLFDGLEQAKHKELCLLTVLGEAGSC
jgi:hypothetical protein